MRKRDIDNFIIDTRDIIMDYWHYIHIRQISKYLHKILFL